MTSATKIVLTLLALGIADITARGDGPKKLAVADFELAESLRKDLLPSTLFNMLLKESSGSTRYKVEAPNSYLKKMVDRYRWELRLGKVPVDMDIDRQKAGADNLLVPSVSRLEMQLVVSATLIDLRTHDPAGTYVVQWGQGRLSNLPEMLGELWRRIERQVFWTFETGMRIRHLAANDSSLAFWSHNGHLYVLDRRTGALRWKRDEIIFDDPELTGKAVYYGDKSGMHKISLETGREDWHVAISGGAYAPVSFGDLVFFGGADGYLRCLEDAGGKERWRYAFRDLKFSSNILPTAPVVDRDRIYFTYSAGVHCVNRMDGKPVWQVKTETGGSNHRLLPYQGAIYLISPDTHLLQAFQAMDGKQLWNYHLAWPYGNKKYPRPLDNLPWGLHALANSMITTRATNSEESLFFALEQVDKRKAYLAAVKAADPRVRWTFFTEETEDVIIDRPYFAQELVFFSSLLGRVYAVSAETGKKKWKLDVSELDEFSGPKSVAVTTPEKLKFPASAYPAKWRLATHPVVYGDVVYFGTMTGTVYALRWR